MPFLPLTGPEGHSLPKPCPAPDPVPLGHRSSQSGSRRLLGILGKRSPTNLPVLVASSSSPPGRGQTQGTVRPRPSQGGGQTSRGARPRLGDFTWPSNALGLRHLSQVFCPLSPREALRRRFSLGQELPWPLGKPSICPETERTRTPAEFSLVVGLWGPCPATGSFPLAEFRDGSGNRDWGQLCHLPRENALGLSSEERT